GFYFERQLTGDANRSVRRARSGASDAGSEAGSHTAPNAQTLSARRRYPARPARYPHCRRKISAHVRTRARRDGPSDRQPEIAHGDDGETPQQTAQARRRITGSGNLRRPRRRHAAGRLGIDLRSDPRRSETGARARRENRRAAFPTPSSVAERPRENLVEVQAYRHRRNERSGPLRLRSPRHHFARPLLRIENRERDENGRTHVSGARDFGKRFQRPK